MSRKKAGIKHSIKIANRAFEGVAKFKYLGTTLTDENRMQEEIPCEYIFSLMNFIVNNQEFFQTNSAVHSVNTRNKHQLHRPIVNLSCFQKSAFYTGIKISNSLPSSLTSLVNKKSQFKAALKMI
jgi:hypothetical protein